MTTEVCLTLQFVVEYLMCSCHVNSHVTLLPVVLGAKRGVLWQDLPEFFEDNMATWMTHFQTLLSTNNTLLISEVMTWNFLWTFF